MGGGAVVGAIMGHIQAGLPVYALEDAALTVHDNLEYVRESGVTIVSGSPGDSAVEVVLGDIDLEALGRALAQFEVYVPELIALAIQDHGFSPTSSNRLVRFEQWRRFLEAGGRVEDLLFDRPPDGLTRWKAAAQSVAGAYFMDTCAAALRGAVLDDYAAARLEDGLVAVNLGNAHTVAALVQGRRVWGVYEHHTDLIDTELLADQMERFSQGGLTHEEVFDQGGHGVVYRPGYKDRGPFQSTVITGPRRAVARRLGRMAAPFGEMMLSGCFGLIEAVREHLSAS
jgi:uncharacterized protein (DUF1786 family)